MAPIDYSMDIADPSQAFLQAFKTGAAINESRMAQEQANRQAEQQKTIEEALARVRQPGATVNDYSNLALLLPDTQAKSVRESFNLVNTDQQQKALQRSGQVFSAFKSGRPDIAIGLLDSQIAARRNGGDEEGAKFLETWRDVAKETPKAAENYFGYTISQMPGGDKIIESIGEIGAEARAQELHPAALKNAEAEATTAQVGAKFAESKALADLEKSGWNIKNIQADMEIAKQNARIAAMNAATAREGNSLKKQELQLKVNEAIQKRDDGIRGKVSEVENARFNIDNLLNTADRIIGTPRGVVESATGPISARMPTLSQDTADFESLIENLDAQAFLSQIPQMKGTGALSENEGKKLAAALQSLSLKQSPDQLVGNVKEMQRLMLKARKSLADKFGMPENVPDTPAAVKSTSATDIDALLKKYGGK